MFAWYGMQLDEWMAQHQAKEAAEKAADQNDDGWTVVRRKGVSMLHESDVLTLIFNTTSQTWVGMLAKGSTCEICRAGKKEDHRCCRHSCWLSSSCCCRSANEGQKGDPS